MLCGFLILFFYESELGPVYSLSFISGALRAAKIGLEDVIVLKVNAKAGNAPALQLDVNVIQMFAEIVGLGTEFSTSFFYLKLLSLGY